MPINVMIWNENRHEKNPKVAELYPEGIHGVIAGHLKEDRDLNIMTATLDEEEHGLTAEVLDITDVLIYWGHLAHGEVSDQVVERIYNRVISGMGLIVLHSGHFSKIFKKLMGTSCTLNWRKHGEKERVWVVEPNHPIAKGLGKYFEIDCEEMYGERFDVPTPDELVFISWFKGGEVFRSGCCYKRGLGKVFYFQPGHETYPTFHNVDVMRVINNAVHWSYTETAEVETQCRRCDPLEEL